MAERGRLQFFVPVLVVNDSQTSGLHWGGKHRRAQRQIDATCMVILQTLRTHGMVISADPAAPKQVGFVVYHPPPAFDEPDGLSATCKHVRDGLIHAGLLLNDAPRDRHRFAYGQVLTRQFRGVLVTVTLSGVQASLEGDAALVLGVDGDRRA